MLEIAAAGVLQSKLRPRGGPLSKEGWPRPAPRDGWPRAGWIRAGKGWTT